MERSAYIDSLSSLIVRLHSLMLQVLCQAGPRLHDALPDQLLLPHRVAGVGPLLQLLLRHLQQSQGLPLCKLIQLYVMKCDD